MMPGAVAANEEKGAIGAAREPRKIVRGIGHDASAVHLDPLALRLQMTPVKRAHSRGRHGVASFCGVARQLRKEEPLFGGVPS